MKKRYLITIILFANIMIQGYSQTETNVPELERIAREQDIIFREKKAEAVEWAIQNGYPAIAKINGSTIEIQYIDEFGRPQYYTTDNKYAAATISANRVHPGGGAGLHLNGLGITVREWDGGSALTTHQEFGGRVINVDGVASDDHATHVAGTIIASGVKPNAKGMAYYASLRSRDWNNDDSEMATEASYGALISNHSYGYLRGWDWNGSSWVWHGNPSISTTEDYLFGFYNSESKQWDLIARNAPYFLICKSAGNDRGDGPGTNPPNDGPYDCIGELGVAKNILTVGAVLDIPGGYSNPSDVIMSSFSSWGPADDGRIKPDIVANGMGLYSPININNSSYDTYSGTSMATPSVSGALALLQEHWQNKTGGNMKAATLKALVIHTADEAGSNTGPDYQFGWGLMNTERAAITISHDQTVNVISEHTLNNGGTYTRNIIAKGNEPLKVTIVWTDVPGTPVSAQLDPSTPMLVNDLDLRLTRSGSTYYPWKLNRNNPANAATNNSENNVDNVEVVFISNPVAGGTYTITVDHDGTINGSTQAFSMIISGIPLPPHANFQADNITPGIGQTVTFFDNSTNTPTSWNWSFYPSTITFTGGTSSTSQNPKVKFNASGYYDVSLTVANSSGTDILTDFKYIAVQNPPIADFTADEDNPGVGQKVMFTDLSTNFPSSWNWSFNPSTVTFVNGTNSSSKNPEVIFNETTQYSVTLVSTNYSGSDSETKSNFISLNTESITLDLKIFLEGPYEGDAMVPGNIGYTPLNQPYNNQPWNYNGQESMNSIINDDVVDWVLVDVLKPKITDGDTTLIRVGRKAALVLTDGSVRDVDQISLLRFSDVDFSPVYIRVIHRNHLEVISSQTVNQSNGKLTFDFSAGPDKALGGTGSIKQLSDDTWGLKAGDGNGNGQVDNLDKNEIWVQQNYMEGYHSADFDLNSLVDNNDLQSKWKANSGSGSHVVAVEINEPPFPPFNPSPENASAGNSVSISLSWSASDPENDSLTYDFYFGTENPPALWYSGISTNVLYFYDSYLEYFTKYYWKVVVHDDHNHYTDGPVWSFSTGYKPNWICGVDSLQDRESYEKYSTVQIGNQCWMAQNLNTGTMRQVPNNGQSNNGVIEKYCYNNIIDSCKSLGGFYEWDEMMQYVIEPSSQGICPMGWHIPSDPEWCTAVKIIDPTVDCNVYGWSGTDAGTKMKSTVGWGYWQGLPGNGTNTSGFTAKPTGRKESYSPYFVSYGYHTPIWSSTTTNGVSHSDNRGFSSNYSQDNRAISTWDKGYSVRCMMYVNQPPEIPSSPQPADNSLLVPINVTLSWSCSDLENDQLTYDVYVSDYFGTLYLMSEGQTENTFTPGIETFWVNTVYFWQIVVHDDKGNTTEGPWWYFTTAPY